MSLNAFEIVMPAIDPAAYLESIGLPPYDWQREALDPTIDRLLLLCARQSGKSTIVAGKVGWKTKYRTRSENLIVCPAKDQSKLVMQKFEEFIDADPEIPVSDSDSVFEKYWGSTKNRVLALPGSERSVRGYSDPETIIADEASRILDSTYRAFRPWMTGGKSEMIAMTTPFGKRGWFYEAWEKSSRWRKILVRVAWEPYNGRLVPAMPEDEYRDYWRERGVSAYYSPRHTKEWLQEELSEIGEWSFRQEYCCEFMDTNDAWFTHEMIMDALVDGDPIENDSDIYVEGEAITV